jgi:hypothetical protein
MDGGSKLAAVSINAVAVAKMIGLKEKRKERKRKP